MAISRQDVLDTALLARIALDEAEADALAGQLGAVLDHMRQLERLDTARVEPMTHAVPLACPLRADEVEPPLDRERALGGAPQRQDDCFAVPHVIPKGARGE